MLITALLAAFGVAQAGERLWYRYGYRPKVYGYPPSSYVFPRYGFVRGYVYFEGPPYGSPLLGDPNHCSTLPAPVAPDLEPQPEVPEPVAPETEPDQPPAPRTGGPIVKPATRVEFRRVAD